MLLKYDYDVSLCPEYIKTSGSGYSTSAVVMKYPFSLPAFTACPPPMTPSLSMKANTVCR